MDESAVARPPVAPHPYLARGWYYVLVGALILALDYLTGPHLQFPILFVLPVGLAAWYHTPPWAYGLAIALPLGRLLLALSIDLTGPPALALANAGIRMAVLLLLAYFVARTARQSRELAARVTELVRICAWSRTIEYRGEWLSFEDYLKRRFNLESTHGVAPAELGKLIERVREVAAKETGGSGRN